jgi:pimeloyl-ACP methyl ester carboxylesterase
MEINCPNIGPITVYMQGTRAANEVVIMTVQDLGCDCEMIMEFTGHPRMIPIRDRTVWLHVMAPGQGRDAIDLPSTYVYPKMRVIGEDLVTVLDTLKVKQVVCFGEGAGANILARFAMAHITRVLGICMLHSTGTAARIYESIQEKSIRWNLDDTSANQTAENYLIMHRFGSKLTKTSTKEESRALIESFQEVLRNKTNMRNLKKFVESYLKRTAIADNIKTLKCPVLLMTGQQSLFYDTTKALHQAIMKTCEDKSKVDFIEVAGVANVVEEKPDKLAECFQYFLQGLGLVSSVPMANVLSTVRNRRLSMEDYDKPSRERKMSGLASPERKLSSSNPPTTNERKLSAGFPPSSERKLSADYAPHERKLSTEVFIPSQLQPCAEHDGVFEAGREHKQLVE